MEYLKIPFDLLELSVPRSVAERVLEAELSHPSRRAQHFQQRAGAFAYQCTEHVPSSDDTVVVPLCDLARCGITSEWLSARGVNPCRSLVWWDEAWQAIRTSYACDVQGGISKFYELDALRAVFPVLKAQGVNFSPLIGVLAAQRTGTVRAVVAAVLDLYPSLPFISIEAENFITTPWLVDAIASEVEARESNTRFGILFNASHIQMRKMVYPPALQYIDVPEDESQDGSAVQACAEWKDDEPVDARMFKKFFRTCAIVALAIVSSLKNPLVQKFASSLYYVHWSTEKSGLPFSPLSLFDPAVVNEAPRGWLSLLRVMASLHTGPVYFVVDFGAARPDDAPDAAVALYVRRFMSSLAHFSDFLVAHPEQRGFDKIQLVIDHSERLFAASSRLAATRYPAESVPMLTGLVLLHNVSLQRNADDAKTYGEIAPGLGFCQAFQQQPVSCLSCMHVQNAPCVRVRSLKRGCAAIGEAEDVPVQKKHKRE